MKYTHGKSNSAYLKSHRKAPDGPASQTCCKLGKCPPLATSLRPLHKRIVITSYDRLTTSLKKSILHAVSMPCSTRYHYVKCYRVCPRTCTNTVPLARANPGPALHFQK